MNTEIEGWLYSRKDGKEVSAEDYNKLPSMLKGQVIALGADLIQLTDHPADDISPSWSPDGRRLAFTSDRSGDNEIYIIDPDAGEQRYFRKDGTEVSTEDYNKLFPDAALRQIATAFDGRMGWHLEDLATGQVHQYRADERFPTASVIKIAVLVELFRQAEVGRLSLDDRHRLRGDISTHGSGVLQIARDEPELTLRDYARLMMGISDNIATDFLMGLLGLDQINATLDRLGCVNVRAATTMGRYHYRMVGMDEIPTNRANDAVYRKRVSTQGLDHASVSFGNSLENNVAAPGELASLLAAIYRGQVVSAAASKAMIELLKTGRDTRMIRCYLKPDVVVAHKYGSSGIIKGDAGLVFLPRGPLVVVAFALARSDGPAAAEAIAEVARLAVEALAPECVVDNGS